MGLLALEISSIFPARADSAVVEISIDSINPSVCTPPIDPIVCTAAFRAPVAPPPLVPPVGFFSNQDNVILVSVLCAVVFISVVAIGVKMVWKIRKNYSRKSRAMMEEAMVEYKNMKKNWPRISDVSVHGSLWDERFTVCEINKYFFLVKYK